VQLRGRLQVFCSQPAFEMPVYEMPAYEMPTYEMPTYEMPTYEIVASPAEGETAAAKLEISVARRQTPAMKCRITAVKRWVTE
jgi:hypothetical protein